MKVSSSSSSSSLSSSSSSSLLLLSSSSSSSSAQQQHQQQQQQRTLWLLEQRSDSANSLDSYGSTFTVSEESKQPHHHDDDDDEHDHTTAVVSNSTSSSSLSTSTTATTTTTTTCPKRVRFSSEAPVVRYETNNNDNEDDNDDSDDHLTCEQRMQLRWYTLQELWACKQEARRMATKALRYNPVWVQTCLDVYLNTCRRRSSTTAAENQVDESTLFTFLNHNNHENVMDETTLGLEGVLKDMARDKKMRRVQLYRRVTQLQQSQSSQLPPQFHFRHYCDEQENEDDGVESTLEERIAMASATLSRTSRLYARYVAMASARSLQES